MEPSSLAENTGSAKVNDKTGSTNSESENTKDTKDQKNDDIEPFVESLLPSTGTKRMADGAEVTSYSDGSKTTRMTNGTIVIDSSDGSKTTTMIPVKGERPDSALTYKKIERDYLQDDEYDEDYIGDDSKLVITTTFPDGTSIYESARDHGKYKEITYPNGTSIGKYPTRVLTTQRDGSSVSKYNDGLIIITSPQGNRYY